MHFVVVFKTTTNSCKTTWLIAWQLSFATSDIQGLIDCQVEMLSDKYGKTREVGVYSHSGERDGPMGLGGTSDPAVAPYYGEIPYSGRQVAKGYWGIGFQIFLSQYPNSTYK